MLTTDPSRTIGQLTQMPPTCHAYPWALVRRGGQIDGQRARTRLAYLTDTYVPRFAARATAMTGFFVQIDRAGGTRRMTKSTVRIDWSDVVASWRYRPSDVQITLARARMARAGGSAA